MAGSKVSERYIPSWGFRARMHSTRDTMLRKSSLDRSIGTPDHSRSFWLASGGIVYKVWVGTWTSLASY